MSFPCRCQSGYKNNRYQEEEKYCETIKSIQDALSDSRYASAVEFLQRARNEIHRTVRLKRTTMKTEDSDEVIKV